MPTTIAKLQDKSVSVTSNGSHTISPDQGYTGLHRVSLDVNVQEPGLIKFYDFDGTLVASYSGGEVQALSALPSAPDHSVDEVPLTFDSWNWTLAEIKTYNTSYPTSDINVGANYHTTDGKAHAYWDIETSIGTEVIINLYNHSNEDTVDWGDGSAIETITTNYLTHTYNTLGEFHCIINSTSKKYTFGTSTTNRGSRERLTKVFLPNTIQYLNPFSYCSRLESVSIPGNVTHTSDDIFNNCVSLKAAMIPRVSSLSRDCFNTCSSLKVVSIPPTLTSILDSDFCYCTQLKSITIPSEVTLIDRSAFQLCSSLRKIVIPNNVTSIGYYSFSSTPIEYIYIPDGVTTIGPYSFAYCSKLQEVSISNSVTTVDMYAFNNCYNLKSISLPDNLVSLGSNAFYGCYSLEKINFPNTLTKTGYAAFSNCRTLKEIIIGRDTTEISGYSFQACYALKSITLPEGVTEILSNSFVYCYSLQKLVIPSTVNKIETYAFNYCYALSSVTLLPTTPPTLGTSVFDTLYQKKIYVPYSADHSVLAAYQSATNWSNFASIMEELPQS